MNLILSKEEYINIMGKRELALPKRWNGNDFEKAVENDLSHYLGLLDGKVTDDFYDRISENVELLIKTIELYHSGYPAEAYNKFESLMTELSKKPFRIYNKNWTQDEFTPDKDPLNLFRIRNLQSNAIVTRSDVFHVPYSYRSKIATSRYSIAGFPCLYLATNLHLCCDETKISSFNDVRIASRYQLERMIDIEDLQIRVLEMGIKPIHFFDYFIYMVDDSNRPYSNMTEAEAESVKKKDNYMKKYFGEIDLMDNRIRERYLNWYPLISCCSYIRTNKGDPFSSEYIVPQLLMQWIRNKSGDNILYGIRYFSCASELASDKGFNYVFPASGKKLEEGYDFCEVLGKAFKMTKPYYIHEFNLIEMCEEFLINNDELDYVSV